MRAISTADADIVRDYVTTLRAQHFSTWPRMIRRTRSLLKKDPLAPKMVTSALAIRNGKFTSGSRRQIAREERTLRVDLTLFAKTLASRRCLRAPANEMGAEGLIEA